MAKTSGKLIARAEAPLKAIISGEHGVVYNVPAATMTFEPKNSVSLFEQKGKPALVIRSDRGSVTIRADGKTVGRVTNDFKPFVKMVQHLMEEKGFRPHTRLVAEIKVARSGKSKVPKGLGSSASLSAALSATIFHAMNKKPNRGPNATKNELWVAVQEAEKVAHGGAPSGVDAMSAVEGATELRRAIEKGEIVWKFSGKKVGLPRDTALIIVDTHKRGKRGNTGELVALFAKNNGLTINGKIKTLHQLTPADKKKLQAFTKVYNDISRHLHSQGNPHELGKAMHRNHELLRAAGVSTSVIDDLVALASSKGAYGAKLTGAGGKGGAVLVLAKKKRVAALQRQIRARGYGVFNVRPAVGGVKLVEKTKVAKPHRK